MISLHGHTTRGELRLDFDLEIAPGLSFVVGPNGAGKTTLLRLLAGLEALESGELTIDGIPVDAPARDAFVPAHRRPIALAFQDHRLFPNLTVVDNVAFPARRRGRSKHDARAAAGDRLEAVGIGDLARRRPEELSIGQRQRAALARALATPASVLLLDEPLASIDEPSRDFIRHQLRSAPHATTVWVSHDPIDPGPAEAVISVAGGSVHQNSIP